MALVDSFKNNLMLDVGGCLQLFEYGGVCQDYEKV
jgi:hypothetical protein